MIILTQKCRFKGGKKKNGTSQTGGGRLATSLNIPIYTPNIEPKFDATIINWGLSSIPWLEDQVVFNHPDSVALAVNKLSSFCLFNDRGVSIPSFTTSKDTAACWINDGNIVFCRTLLRASAGKGIVVARKVEELVNAPLYSRYIKKKWEIRVHVCKEKVFHITQKRRLTTEELEVRGIDKGAIEPLIRNVDNGYIFSVSISDELLVDNIKSLIEEQAIKALKSLGLTFGAVDICISNTYDIYVLEVNTAPGLEGTTLLKYEEVFKKLLE